MTDIPTNVVVAVREDILWLTINRPDSRNALSRATLSELAAACAQNAGRDSLKAAVIMGEGREAFAAGGDLKELNGLRAAEDVAAFFDFASNALDQIRNFPMPTVAALNGKALGGGAELALACDFRVAAAHASIGYIHATLNICCGFGGGADLMRALGASGGLLRGLYADTLDAHAALSLHLVDQVSSDGEPLADCVMRFLAPMLKQNVQVIRAYKAMAIAERQGLGMQQRRAIEREGFKGTWTSAAHWSAVESIERKRRERTG